MKKISQLFFQGLIAILPIALTLYLLFWLASLAESVLGGLLRSVFPDSWYWPGTGIIAGILFILGIGLLLDAYVFRQIAKSMESWLTKIPLINTIYNSIRDIADFASGSKDGKLQKVVLVRLDDDVRVMGFVTREGFTLGEHENLTAVYVPMSYQIGGFTLFLPPSKFEHLDMKVKDAMHFALTGGVAKPREHDKEHE